MKKYYTADYATNTIIDEFSSLSDALSAIQKYEADDVAEGVYEPNFYCVIDENFCLVSSDYYSREDLKEMKNTKKYWIKHYKNFRNTFSVRWSYDEQPKDEGYTRITRADAIKWCKEERAARKNDPSSAGYGDTHIIPFDAEEGEIFDPYDKKHFICDGYVIDRR